MFPSTFYEPVMILVVKIWKCHNGLYLWCCCLCENNLLSARMPNISTGWCFVDSGVDVDFLDSQICFVIYVV